MNAGNQAAHALLQLLTDDNAAHRCLAAQALGRTGGSAAVPALLERLHDEDEDVRLDAVEALGALGDSRAVEPLCGLFASAPPEARAAIVQALGRLAGARAEAVLLEVAAGGGGPWNDNDDDEEWDVQFDARCAAFRALAARRVAGAANALQPVALDEPDDELAAEALRALAAMGASGRTALLDVLAHGRAPRRRLAARLLCGEQHPGVLQGLHAALEDESPAVRATAARALDCAGQGVTVERLSALLADDDAEVRGAAVGFLKRFPPGALAGLWRNVLRDRRPQVRRAAVAVLGGFRAGSAVPVLVRALDDPEREVALEALGALERIRGKPALEALGAVLRDANRPSALRVRACEALQYREQEEAQALVLSVLHDEEPALRLCALRVLAAAGDGPGATLLEEIAAGRIPAAGSPEQPAQACGANGMRAAGDAAQAPGGHDAGAAEPGPVLAAHGVPTDDGDPLRSTVRALLHPEMAPSPAACEPQPLSGQERAFAELVERNIGRAEAVLRPPPPPRGVELRAHALRMLAERGTPGDPRLWLAAMASDEPLLQREAAGPLGRTGAPQALAALVKRLGAPDWQVRLAVVRGLAAFGGTQAGHAVLQAWPDDSAEVRRELLLALEDVREPAVRDVLARGLEDRSAEVVKAAAIVAVRRNARALQPGLERALRRHRSHDWRGLGRELAHTWPGGGAELLAALAEPPAADGCTPLAVSLLEEIALSA